MRVYFLKSLEIIMDKIRVKIASLNTQLNSSTNCQALADGSEKNNQKNRGLRGKRSHVLSGAKVPWVELSFPGTFAPWNFRSMELSSPGTFAPESENNVELSLP